MTLFAKSVTQSADQKRLVVARLQLADLESPSASIVKIDQMEDMDRVHPVTFLDLPDGYAVSTEGMPKDSITVRMLKLMAVEQWRGSEIPAELQEDHAASKMLMVMLSRHCGYTAVVAGINEGFDKSKLNKGGSAYLGQDDIGASVDRFFDTLVAGGWTNGGVYLTRPAPDLGSANDIKPFEMTVRHGLIGWKLPQDLVGACLQVALDRADQSQNVHRDRQAA